MIAIASDFPNRRALSITVGKAIWSGGGQDFQPTAHTTVGTKCFHNSHEIGCRGVDEKKRGFPEF